MVVRNRRRKVSPARSVSCFNSGILGYDPRHIGLRSVVKDGTALASGAAREVRAVPTGWLTQGLIWGGFKAKGTSPQQKKEGNVVNTTHGPCCALGPFPTPVSWSWRRPRPTHAHSHNNSSNNNTHTGGSARGLRSGAGGLDSLKKKSKMYE